MTSLMTMVVVMGGGLRAVGAGVLRGQAGL